MESLKVVASKGLTFSTVDLGMQLGPVDGHNPSAA